ncbi:MAG: hypothetical protein OEM99_18190 [Gammaproteobacteria bacterium]|nr:hypothetical protein [Gammaproteobacteria bacterium]
MKKVFLGLGLALLSASCATPEAMSDGCEGLGWSKTVTVEYGDGGITITPKKNVKRKSLFIIKLKPKSDDYKDKVVTIVGKAVTPGGAGVAGPGWLNTSDSYNTRKKFIYCTPDLTSETAQEYTYSVEVGDGLLFVDPRVNVTW